MYSEHLLKRGQTQQPATGADRKAEFKQLLLALILNDAQR